MSTINYTYNVIVDRFRQFADGHFQLRRFTHGEISQADLEKEAEWPWMHVKPRAINYAPGTRTFSFEIFISDLPRDKEDKTGYQAESITDCSLIFQDLINEIHLGHMFGDDVVLTRPVNSEPFVEQYTHTLTGVTGIIELSLDYDWSACSIPASWNYNTPTDSPSDGWGALQFIESLDQNGVFVSLLNDEEAPGNSYYYGTDGSGIKGWYAIVDNIGLTCETLPDCAVIISITDDIIALQTDVALKANSADLGATAFSNDYNDLDNLPTLPTGTVTSVALTMPSAFSVANSPITSSGSLDVTGAGTVSQYVRGDGSLANFPASTGGGGSLSYYLNGSVAQGTFGGVAMKEMDRTPIIGAGTDFTIATNGYIQSFITDANVPNLLEIPAGNWNFETYFSSSSAGGTPSFYIELYKWDGATLSLIASNSAAPEGITNGTAIHLYVSALAIPQTTLALTDRLAIRIYVTHSGRTIKLHTENSHLCQVITTFSTGLTALNGLTAQVQNLAVGTTGTDFGISSATSTHTFNLPTASAANRGALSSADWSSFNGKFTLPALTSGSVLFSNGTTIAQDNANLFWDDTNNRLGIGSAAPANTLDVAGNVRLLNGAAQLLVNNATYSELAYGTTNYFRANGALAIVNGPIIQFLRSGSEVARFATTTGNLLIGTTTDAGFRLDVNGTARLSGTTTITPATLTGSTATSALDISQTWNTTGTPIALKVNITDTASAALSDLMSLQVGGSARFRVLKSGFFIHNTGGEIAGNLVVGGSTIDASSQVEVRSITKGFLPPRMTTTQKNAIASPAAGLVIYDTDLKQLCTYNGTWGISPFYQQSLGGVKYFTDFDNTASSTPNFAGFTVGGAVNRVTTNVPNWASNQIGVCQYQTGVTTTGYFTHINEGFIVNQFIFGGGAWVFESYVNVETLSTLTDRFRFVSGFGNAPTNASEQNGAFFTYDEGGIQNGTAASPNWQCVTTLSSTRTLTTTTTAVVASAWTKLRIEVNAAGTSVTFYVNGTLVATHTTNIPTYVAGNAARGFNVKQGILKATGLTNRNVYCDYLLYENNLTTLR
jgi:hypothetical protein